MVLPLGCSCRQRDDDLLFVAQRLQVGLLSSASPTKAATQWRWAPLLVGDAGCLDFLDVDVDGSQRRHFSLLQATSIRPLTFLRHSVQLPSYSYQRGAAARPASAGGLGFLDRMGKHHHGGFAGKLGELAQGAGVVARWSFLSRRAKGRPGRLGFDNEGRFRRRIVRRYASMSST